MTNNYRIFEEIYNKNIKHTTFIDKNAIIKCIEESYMMGVSDGENKVNQEQVVSEIKNSDIWEIKH
jgi:hypothetical protein